MPVTNLPYIQKGMVRYGMSIYFAIGLLGNICNCIMFIQPSYRRTPSSVYLLFLSTIDICYLMWLLPYQFYILNYTDPQTYSLFYCKIRLYIGHVLGLYLRYSLVFACIDRFIVTRENVRIRSLHSIPVARKIILVICGVSLVIAMHAPILMEIRGGVCGMYGSYKLIYAFYQIIVTGLIPPVLMCTFSALTIRSLHQRHGNQVHARHRDRQLMRMLIAEVVVNVSTSIPYSCNLIYSAATYYVADKSTERVEIEAFITFFANFLIYLISVAPFYLFISISKPFRNEFFNMFIKYLNKYIPQNARIAPLTQQYITGTINGRTVVDNGKSVRY